MNTKKPDWPTHPKDPNLPLTPWEQQPLDTKRPDWVNGQPKTLKALRMWHWREYLRVVAIQRRLEGAIAGDPEPYEQTRRNLALARDTANLHLSAVQVLNDSLPGTAEQDCAQEDEAAAIDDLFDRSEHPPSPEAANG